MKILVTGNLGYVGSVVVPHLRRVLPDAEIVGLDTAFFASALTGADISPEVALDQQRFGDVRSFDPALCLGVDHVIHLAAISNDPIGNAFAEVTYEINHAGTIKVAQAARRAGVKSFVFASSCSMYGAAAGPACDESAPLAPLTPYARSKVMAEQDLRDLATPEFRVTALRFATACGMSPRLRLDLVLNDFVAGAVASGTISVLSDGTPWRPLINVRDMARAVTWAVVREPGGPDFLAVNVGRDDWNQQIRDLASTVGALVDGTRVTINQDAAPDGRSYRVDFRLFERLAPEHQPETGLRGTVEALRNGLGAMGFSDRDFRRSKLMRLNHLTMLRERGHLDAELRWIRRGVGAGER